MDDKPCCTAAAVRKIRQLIIGGCPLGIVRLDETMDEIKAMHLRNEVEIGEALLKRAKIFNYVPSSAVLEYRRALLDEYKRRG